jgi:hypothetical protein
MAHPMQRSKAIRRLTLWDVHAKYFRGNWDLQALYGARHAATLQITNAP